MHAGQGWGQSTTCRIQLSLSTMRSNWIHLIRLHGRHIHCAVKFPINLPQAIDIWEEGIFTERIPPLDWSVLYFLEGWVMWEGSAYCEWFKPWVGAPGMYKKAFWEIHKWHSSVASASSSIPRFLSRLIWNYKLK